MYVHMYITEVPFYDMYLLLLYLKSNMHMSLTAKTKKLVITSLMT